MRVCRNRETQLMMSVHGELSPPERRDWESHAAVCSACREEARRLGRIMGRAAEALSGPVLSSGEAEHMKQVLLKRDEPVGTGSRGMIFFPKTSAVFAMILLIAGAAFLMNGHDLKESRGIDTVIGEDVEIIQNLDLLKNYGTIEQLIQVVDHREIDGTSHPEADHKEHETVMHETVEYA